jgi:ParB/RepB/Spo0J family partition protein
MQVKQEQIVELPLGVIERGFYQPREYFNADAMESTRRSIQEKGQKYPVIVRAIAPGNALFDPAWPQTHYELADGERRFRCCKELGLPLIKALVRDLSDEEMLDYTVTTNDSLPLNPIEKAYAFARLAKDFGKSQAEIARSFNLKQQQVSEYIRLLELPKEIQDLTARAVISVRHARELLKVADAESMKNLASEVENKSLSTRELTKILKNDDLKSRNRINIPKKIFESINISDISFESDLDKTPIESSQEISQLSAILLEENRPERQKILGSNRSNNKLLALLDRFNTFFIPKKLYFRMEMWLNLDLGSRDRPERWMSKLEISLSGGAVVALAALFLPSTLGVSLLAVLSALLLYLFIF